MSEITEITEQECLDVFKKCGVNPTAIRLLVYRSMYGFDYTFSLADMEARLHTIDKSTLFRTLTLFHEKGLVHTVEDGSGSIKYCLCHKVGECTIADRHCHFFCEVCQRTFCLDHTPVPTVSIPKGFEATSLNYVIKGRCANCIRNHKR